MQKRKNPKNHYNDCSVCIEGFGKDKFVVNTKYDIFSRNHDIIFSLYGVFSRKYVIILM